MRKIYQNIYNMAPIWLQNEICSAVGYKIKQERYNALFDDALRKSIMRQAWSFQDLKDYRDSQIQLFVKYAVNNTTYYSRLFEDLGLKSDDINCMDDLKKIPILTKSEVKQNYKMFLADGFKKSDLVMSHTSGTTGSGLVFPVTKSAVYEQWAVWWRYRIALGINLDTKCGYFGGRPIVPIQQSMPPFWRHNRPGKQIVYSAYHLSESNIDLYLEDILNRRLTWLHGYPSVISLLASRILESKSFDLSAIKRITLGAENVNEHQYKLIENAFGVAPNQHYGMAEGVANISETPTGSLQVDEDFAAVEFISDAKISALKIIGTNFTNYAFPLIRYDTGDTAVLSNFKKDGQTSLPRIVQRIDGRSEDYLILKDGTKIGRLDHILKDMVNITESQFAQDRPGSAILNIVPNSKYSMVDEIKLKTEIDAFLGNKIDIIITKVTRIPRTSAGKIKFVMNNIKGNHQ